MSEERKYTSVENIDGTVDVFEQTCRVVDDGTPSGRRDTFSTCKVTTYTKAQWARRRHEQLR